MPRYRTHVPTLWFGKTSVMAAPDTLRNDEPAKPVRKRKTWYSTMWFANATGRLNTVFVFGQLASSVARRGTKTHR